MRLTFQHTLADIMELNCSVREQRIKGWLVILAAVAAWVIGIWLLLFPLNDREPTVLLLAAGALTVLGFGATRLAGFGAWVLKAQRAPYVLEVGPEGIAFLSGRDQSLVSWAYFSRWLLTKNLLVLISAADAIAIPKRSCDAAGWIELLALVREQVGCPARW